MSVKTGGGGGGNGASLKEKGTQFLGLLYNCKDIIRRRGGRREEGGKENEAGMGIEGEFTTGKF